MIKVRGSGRIETPEKKLLRSATTALRPKTKVVLPEKHLDVGPIPKREAAAMRAAFSASESRAELRHVIDRETALRQAPATNSEAPVDKYRKTSHNPPDMGLLHEYLRTTLGVPESLVPELAADMHALALARVKAEVTGRAAPVAAPAPFAEALEAMTLKERRAALDQHYAARKKNTWAQAKGDKPTPEKFLAWLDVVFPDRRKIGLVLSDLKHLDEAAYDKVVMGWARKNSKIEKTVIESFGLPTKITPYDAERDANAPKSFAEVVEQAVQGKGSFKKLNRDFKRTLYHAPSP